MLKGRYQQMNEISVESKTSETAIATVRPDEQGAQVNRLGTAHRIETLRNAEVLDRNFGTVVDIGGFDGVICSLINASERVVIEPFPPAEELRAKSVRFIHSGGQDSSLAADSADLVMLLDVLEHVEDPAELVNEAVRVLKPGGTGVITVPSRDIRIFPWLLQNWADRRWDHTIRRGYRPEELETHVTASGAELVRTLDMGCFLFRALYLPISIFWRGWQVGARRTLNAMSKLDYRFKSFGSGRGYIFIEFRKPE